jgi:hypothetical protein
MCVVPANTAAKYNHGSAGAVGFAGHRGRSSVGVPRRCRAVGVSWNTANNPVLAEWRRALIDDPTGFHGVRML